MGCRRYAFRTWTSLGVLSSLLLGASNANAWILEEHSRIGREAFTRMATHDAASAKTLQEVWPVLRERLGDRACQGAYRPARTPNEGETCVDIPALAALAADHSCSPRELAATVRHADWLPRLLNQANKTIIAIDKGFATPSAHLDAWRADHIELQSADTQYLFRAEHNSVHFLLSRSEVYGPENLPNYLRRVSGPNTEFNGAAAYLLYHAQALALAARGHAHKDNREKARAVLVESFALHFLEDMFSVGHVVGTGGSRAMRIGTHDHYCEKGADITTWNGVDYGAHGDAFQTGTDVDMAAPAIEASLIQLAKVLDGRIAAPIGDEAAIEDFDICRPERVSTEDWFILNQALLDNATVGVMQQTPRPFREDFEPPRFENEVGAFVRVTTGGRALSQLAGTDESGSPYTPRGRANVDFGFGGGVALAGAISRGMDGLIFAQADLTANSKEFSLNPSSEPVSISKRFGVGGRIRMPFMIFPGDFLFYGLFVAPFSVQRFLDYGIRAAQGGAAPFLIPLRLQKILMMGPLTFQFMFGREVALHRIERDSWFVGGRPLDVHTWELEAPAFELRTKPQFSDKLGASAFAQLGVGTSWNYESWGTPDPAGRTDRLLSRNFMVFLRLGADGRFYFTRF